MADFFRKTVLESILFLIEKMPETNTVCRQLAVVYRNIKFLDSTKNLAMDIKQVVEKHIDQIKIFIEKSKKLFFFKYTERSGLSLLI